MRDHGGDLDRAQRRFGPGPWLDLSTGINAVPYPVPDLAPQAWTRLPDRSAVAALEQAAAARGITPEALQAEAGDADWWQAPLNRDALSTLGSTLGLAPAAERSQQLQTETPALQGEALDAEVFRQLYADIIAAQSVDAAQLLALADARALAVKQHIVDVLGFDHQRISVTKARESDLTGRVLTLEIEAM
jgi:hypothetical protein